MFSSVYVGCCHRAQIKVCFVLIAIINHELHPDCSNLFISETMYVDLHHTVLHTVLSVCVQYFYDYKSTDTQYQYYYRYISNCYIYTLKCVFFFILPDMSISLSISFCSVQQCASVYCQCDQISGGILPLLWPSLLDDSTILILPCSRARTSLATAGEHLLLLILYLHFSCCSV